MVYDGAIANHFVGISFDMIARVSLDYLKSIFQHNRATVPNVGSLNRKCTLGTVGLQATRRSETTDSALLSSQLLASFCFIRFILNPFSVGLTWFFTPKMGKVQKRASSFFWWFPNLSFGCFFVVLNNGHICCIKTGGKKMLRWLPRALLVESCDWGWHVWQNPIWSYLLFSSFFRTSQVILECMASEFSFPFHLKFRKFGANW